MKKLLLLILLSVSALLVLFSYAFTNKADIDISEPVLYIDVDKLPVFKHNNMRIMEYIYSNLEWPENFDGQGSTIVSFVVTKTGKVKDLTIEKELHPECSEQVKKIFDSMSDWLPGKIKNIPVDVKLFLSIYFKLE